MQLEITKGSGKQPWRWRLRSGSKVNANNEGHRDRTDAVRAGQGVVIGIVRTAIRAGVCSRPPIFTQPEWSEKRKAFVVKWGFPGAGG